MRILISSDWHIREDGRIWKHEPEPINDLRYAVEYLCNFILEKKIDAVILAGDLTDRPILSSYGLDILRKFVDICKKRNTRIFFVQGQHDRADPPILSAFDGYCQNLNRQTARLNGLTLFGLDYINSKDDIPSCTTDIFVTHQVFKEFVGYQFGMFSFSDFNSCDCRIFVTGDFHKPYVIEEEKKKIVSPGSLIPQGIDEFYPRSIFILENLDIIELPLPGRDFFVKEVYKKDDLVALESFIAEYKPKSSLPKELQRPVVAVKFASDVISAQELKDLFYDKCIVLPKIISTEQETAEIQTNPEDVNDLASIIDSLTTNETVRVLCRRIIAEKDINAVKEFFEGVQYVSREGENKESVSA